MSELSLTFTEKFQGTGFDCPRVQVALSKHLRVGPPRHLRRASEDWLPQFIMLLGSSEVWAAIEPYAREWLIEFGKRLVTTMAESVVKKKETEPIVDVSKTLIDGANGIGGEVKVHIGLDIPDHRFGATIEIDPSEPALEVERKVSIFVVSSPKIEKMLRSEIAEGSGPSFSASVEVGDDGGVIVKWESQVRRIDWTDESG